MNDDASTDIHAISDYEAAVRRLLEQQKFETLECLSAGLRSRREKFSGGVWKIHTLYAGLSHPTPSTVHATETDWDALLDELQRWLSAHPDSVTAHIALASADMNYGWFARGSNYSNTVQY